MSDIVDSNSESILSASASTVTITPSTYDFSTSNNNFLNQKDDPSNGHFNINLNISMPNEIRNRLHNIFGQIEKEFEILYSENIRLQQLINNTGKFTEEKIEKSSVNEPINIANVNNPIFSSHSSSSSSSSPKLNSAQSSSTASSQITSLTSSLTSSAVNAFASTSSSAKSAILSSKTKINNLSFPKFRPNAREFIMQSLKNTSQQIVNKTQNHHSNVFSTKLQTSLSGHKDGIWDINCLQIPQYLLTNDINQQLNTNILVGTASADSTARLWYFNSHFIDGNCAGSHGISSNGCNQLSPLPQSTNQIFKFSSDKQMSTCSFCIQEYSGHTGSVNSIRFHPKFFTEGTNLILTGSGDCQAHIWQCVLSPTFDSLDNNNDSPLNYSNYYAFSMNCISDRNNLNNSTNVVSMPTSPSLLNQPTNMNNPSQCYQDLLAQTSVIRSPIKRYEGHTDACIAADWFPDGDLLATASWDRTANVYNVETGKILCNLQHDDYLTNVSIQRANKLILTSSKDTTFKLWDLRDPVWTINMYQGHSRSVNSAIFIGDDKIATSSDDQTAKLWDLRIMRSPICTINVNSGVNRICTININDSANSETFLCLPLDNRDIKIYNLQGERLLRLPRNNRAGHKRLVTSVASCGNFLFSASFDKLANCTYLKYNQSKPFSFVSKLNNISNKENNEHQIGNNNYDQIIPLSNSKSETLKAMSSPPLVQQTYSSSSSISCQQQPPPLTHITNNTSNKSINTLAKLAEKIKI